MTDLAREIIGTQPILTLFLAIGLGYLVGQINIFGFSLGVGAVLFVGLALGAFAPKAQIVGPIGLTGLIMFVICLVTLWEARNLALFDRLGPGSGFFPFYLALILGAASLYGLVTSLVTGAGATTFVTRDQLRRVMQVFVPTLLFCIFTQWLGLYVASFLLIAGFMWITGRIALWKSLLTAFLFAALMFVTFDIAFDVIMPKGPLEAALGY